MSSKKQTSKKQAGRPVPPKKTGKKTGNEATGKRKLIEVLDSHFAKNAAAYFIICLVLNIIIGIYLFDVKVSTGEDDSGYIVSAKQFLEGTAFPGWHGPFYSMFLSLLVALFGVKLMVFKVFSFLFIIGHFIFFYYSFKGRLSPAILVITSLIISVNSQILYFASQTYSEALFLLLQSLFFFVFFKLQDAGPDTLKDQIRTWKYWLGMGLLVFLMTITRNIGIAVLGAIILFFLFERKFWAILATLASYLVFRIPFNMYKRIAWDLKGAEFSAQMNEILLKDPYSSTLGQEDLGGMVTRFWDNALIYLSRHFSVILGLKPEGNVNTSSLATILIIVLVVLAFVLSIRRNKTMLFVTLYLGVMIGGTFIALQKNWGQMRMIVIYAPLMILSVSWALMEIPWIRKRGILQLMVLLLMCIVFMKVFSATAVKIKYNQKVLAKNMRGNRYYGFTPDWQNFLKMSEWVGKNLPDSTVVVSRKPSMSFIYSEGKEFYPMYRFPTEDADTLMARIEKRTGPLTAIRQNEVFGKNIPFGHQLAAKASIVAVVNQENDVYTLHRKTHEPVQALDALIQQYQLSPVGSDSLLSILHRNNQSYYGISPDTLLNNLRVNRVEYVIAASLRANPHMKTERIINTVQRYLYIIEIKYPGIFSLHHQIGDNNNEPAFLYKINYSLYGMEIPKP